MNLPTPPLPTPEQAEQLLREAEALNPGPWVTHSRNVALAAKFIAEQHPTFNPERAYTLGLLHDIGRRTGPNKDRHVLDGYDHLTGLGFHDAARITLTHSVSFFLSEFTLLAPWDGTPQELWRLHALLNGLELTEEDRLFQLCDVLAMPDGFSTLPERLLDVALRYGVHPRDPERWRMYLDAKAHFNQVCGVNIYRLLPGLCERLLA